MSNNTQDTKDTHDNTDNPDSLKSISDQLGHSNQRVVWRTLSQLIDIGPAAVLSLVDRLLSSQERQIQERAARALGKIGDPRAVGPLVTALKGSTFQAREFAAQALRRLGAVDALVGILANSGQAASRAAAARELGNIKNQSTIKHLVTALRDPDRFVRSRAADALGQIGAPAVPLAARPLLRTLEDTEVSVRNATVKALGQLRVRDASAPLFVMLLDPSRNQITRWQIVEALARIDESNVSAALSHPDPAVRFTFAIHMSTRMPSWPGGQHDGRAVPVLIEALGHRDAHVRREAVRRLRSCGDHRAVEALAGALDDPDSEVRQWAASSLYGIGDDRAVEPLIRTLNDADQRVRASAATSLGWLRDIRAMEPLLNSLTDPDANVRVGSLHALGQLVESVPGASDVLAGALVTPETLLRQLVQLGVIETTV